MTDPGPPFFDVVLAQRACREFGDDPVDDATIEVLLRAATHAPSAENRQPWEFVVVRDPAVRSAVHDVAEAAWRSFARDFSAGRLPEEMLEEVDRAVTGGGYRTAPVLVVVCGDTERALAPTLPSSIFPCVQNLLLAASALGLGSALTTLATHADELAPVLRLPDHVRPLAVVPLGHPARPLGPPRREPVADYTHRDRYGRGW